MDSGFEIGSLNPPSLPAVVPKQFSVEAYHQLAAAGFLDDEERVELLEGVISPKMIHSPMHDAVVSIIEQRLRGRLDPDWIMRIQSSITLSESEPEPDLAIAHGPPTRYLHQHPGGEDLAMVIEVAETSILRDRAKAATYAKTGIPVYWIVNLKQKRLEVFAAPKQGEYTRQHLIGLGETVELAWGFMAAEPLNVSELIPDDSGSMG